MLKGKTPFEMLHGKPPLYSHIRSFGFLLMHMTVNCLKINFKLRVEFEESHYPFSEIARTLPKPYGEFKILQNFGELPIQNFAQFSGQP